MEIEKVKINLDDFGLIAGPSHAYRFADVKSRIHEFDEFRFEVEDYWSYVKDDGKHYCLCIFKIRRRKSEKPSSISLNWINVLYTLEDLNGIDARSMRRDDAEKIFMSALGVTNE